MAHFRKQKTLAALGVATMLLTASVQAEMAAERYSIRMAKSIISRGQGIVNNESDTSIWLQAGFTQKAFQAVVNQYGDWTDIDTTSISDYIITSSKSAAVPLSNATANLKRSLDRHSNGNSFIKLYKETGDDIYEAGIEGLKTALDRQTRNAEGGLSILSIRIGLI